MVCGLCIISFLGRPNFSANNYTGHNMSQADANSVAEENQRQGHTGTGCYKQHDHHASRPPEKPFPSRETKQLVNIRSDEEEEERPESPEYQTPVS